MSFSGLSWGTRAGLAALALGTALTAGSGPARAQVTEPNGLVVPQPVQPAETNIATSRGFTAPALTLQGLFSPQCFNDPIDPIMDADIAPAAFSPLCGFTGTLVMRGGGCRLELGWYNATGTGITPTDAEIFTLVPADTVGRDFCPLAAVHTNDPNRADTAMITAECNSCPLGRGTGVTTFSADGIRTNPNFRGPEQGGTGLIGFALRGSASTQCPQTHFSENDLNPDCTTGCTTPGPWIMTLVYTSKSMPDSFYIAFEDLPATNFGPNTGQNDGDFNDFVYLITGLTCEGGGQPCVVPGVVGACAAGVTACGPGGTIICSPRIDPTPEVCDNIDNDCNGMVDDDPTLCVADSKVCYQGKCVPRCNTGEFQCLPGETCVGSLCVDVACETVTCLEGQICRGGACVGACDGVVCPLTANGRQECQLGRCVDLCAAATCPAETVCEKGSCVRNCACRDCPDGSTCNRDEASPVFGQCVDMRCASMPCPAGDICFEGVCGNPCAGVQCPGGAACTDGVCGPPGTAGTGGTSSGGSSGSAGTIIAGTSLGASSGNGGGSAASGGGGGADGDVSGTPTGDPGCACSSVGSRNASWLVVLAAAGLAGAFGARRRRQRA